MTQLTATLTELKTYPSGNCSVTCTVFGRDVFDINSRNTVCRSHSVTLLSNAETCWMFHFNEAPLCWFCCFNTIPHLKAKQLLMQNETDNSYSYLLLLSCGGLLDRRRCSCICILHFCSTWKCENSKCVSILFETTVFHKNMVQTPKSNQTKVLNVCCDNYYHVESHWNGERVLRLFVWDFRITNQRKRWCFTARKKDRNGGQTEFYQKRRIMEIRLWSVVQ